MAEEIAAAPARRSLLREEDPVAPPLLWSEARSNLHERVHRGELERAVAVAILADLESGWLRAATHPRLTAEAWHVADSSDGSGRTTPNSSRSRASWGAGS